MSVNGWTPDQIEILKAGWKAGDAAAAIAARVGRSKSSVIAKASRLALGPHAAAPSTPMQFPLSELDTIPLRRPLREALSALLDAYPEGITQTSLASRMFDDADIQPSPPHERVRRALAMLRTKINPVGWDCGRCGERRGVRLHPIEARANG